MTKTEAKNILELIKHTKMDIGFGSGGTFCESGDTDKTDTRAIAKVEDALESLEFIMQVSIIK